MAVAKFLCHAMVMYDILEKIIHIKKNKIKDPSYKGPQL